MRSVLIAAALSLAACTPMPVKPPKIVTVVSVQYVKVPADLTKACPIAMPQTLSAEEAVRIARVRRTSLEKCNDQLKSIRSLGSAQ